MSAGQFCGTKPIPPAGTRPGDRGFPSHPSALPVDCAKQTQFRQRKKKRQVFCEKGLMVNCGVDGPWQNKANLGEVSSVKCQVSSAASQAASPRSRVHGRSCDPRGSDGAAQARGEGVPPLRGTGIPSTGSGRALPVRLCGIGILPMTHGLEGDPQRGILRWGPQAHATSVCQPRPPTVRRRGGVDVWRRASTMQFFGLDDQKWIP